jgi:transposase
MGQIENRAKIMPLGKRRVLHTDAFKREAVCLAASGSRTMTQIASELGMGHSTLGKWKLRFERADLMAGSHDDLHKELAMLGLENALLRAERDLFKKAPAFYARETSRWALH